MAQGRAGHGEAAPGDHLQVGYQLWLVGHQLEHGRAPWRDPYSFQPEVEPRWNLAGWPFGLVYWPLQRAFGTVAAWNLFVLLGFLGAGGFTALWLRELGLRREGALTGGLAFCLAPYLQAQWSLGHLLPWIALLLPLSLYGLERARRHSRWWLLLSGVALASIPLSGQLHLALGAIPFFALYAFVRLRWATLLVLPALAAGLLADFAAVRGTTGASGRSFVQVEHYSAELRDLLSRHQPQELEGFVYLGWTVQLIALAGLAVLLSQRRWGLSLALGLGALVPMLFALGANLAGYHFALAAPARAPAHARPGAPDADRLPRPGGAGCSGGLPPAVAGDGGDGLPAPARRSSDRRLPRHRRRRAQPCLCGPA